MPLHVKKSPKKQRMKICVLQPDYSTSNVDYQHYDPPRELQHLLPNHTVHTVFLNKLTTYQQLQVLKAENFDIYVNLCEGYLDWSVPSIDVIHSLDLLNLPYTGPNAILYDPPKPLMKYVAYCAGVLTPNFVELNNQQPIAEQVTQLRYPLFVKPAKAGDSLGVDEYSLVHTTQELSEKKAALIAAGYTNILIEEYIAGKEFTVLVAANASPINTCTVFKPVEYQFPAGKQFKTYALKTSELHTDVNKPCSDAQLELALKTATEKIFTGFAGVGYARLDFRVSPTNEIYFLEINVTCSVFYESGYEGSADYILQLDPIGKSGFLKHIIEEGIARHNAKQKKYFLKGNSVNGYGIFANQLIKKGTVIFKLEESAQRIVTKRYVKENWSPEALESFAHYAYPISDEVYILWDTNPTNWAPQNHSCSANTNYDGLNVVALTDIPEGKELTLDYANLLDGEMGSFTCTCGSENCRKNIRGMKGNSITQREKDHEKL